MGRIQPGLPLPLNGRTRLYAIVGDPIAQAGSPTLFNTAFRTWGVKAVLVPIHVAPADLPTLVAAFRAARNFDGLVITVPHKIAATSLVDDIGSMGQRIGAVNAIRKDARNRLVGDNFDGFGFVAGLARRGHSLAGKKILLIGAGGAGLAIAHAALDQAPQSLGIFDIDCQRVSLLTVGLSRLARGVDVHSAIPDADGYDVVINCTSLGMKETDPLPVAIERLAPSTLVVDIILQPETSRLLRMASSLGCATHPGRYMLEGQIEEICRFFGLAGNDNGGPG